MSKEGGPAIAILDLELAPNLATVWGLFKQNIAINQLLETSRVLCFSVKWYGRRGKPMFFSEWTDGQAGMLQAAHSILTEADIVVGYNSASYDVPILHREFAKLAWFPPSPVVHVDLLKVVRKKFRFTSNKLDHVARELGVGEKVSHPGHEMWLKVMSGDGQAQGQMRTYNIGDVVLTEKVYTRLLPWIGNHPVRQLYGDKGQCPNCGSDAIVARGYRYTRLGKYQAYHCKDCGSWHQSKKCIETADIRGVQA